MKKLQLIVMLILACVNYTLAQNPYYYDECWNSSTPFSFPVEREIKDTMWFTATIDDIKQGISATWYSNVSVSMQVFAFCTSKTPSFELTVGPNRMMEMEVSKIQKKLDEMGEMAQMMAQTLTPHIRIFPHNKGKGEVYCYPYDQGPHSTCEKTLPVFANMTNVCSATDNVYMLIPSRMSSYGRGFIVWKQKKNLPSTVYITKGACNGPEIQRAQLNDSLHVMILDSVAVKAAKTANDTLYIHVEHPDDYAGRIIYHNTIRWKTQVIDTTFCQGKRLDLPDTTLVETTVSTKDTLWTKDDTLAWTTYKVTVIPPEMKYDTLRLKSTQLPKTYNGTYIPKDGWGDYDWRIHKANQCDQVGKVHVIHNYTTAHQTIDTTICRGKAYTFGGHVYAKDTTVADSAWTTPDIWTVAQINLHIQVPELEFDTVPVPPSKMSAGYVYKPYNIVLKQYGDTTVIATQKGQCDRMIQITVLKGEDPTTSTDYLQNNQPATGKFLRNGMLFIRRNGNDYDIYGRKINH